METSTPSPLVDGGCGIVAGVSLFVTMSADAARYAAGIRNRQ
jgi:hypothetical protein